VTWAALDRGVALDDEAVVVEIARTARIVVDDGMTAVDGRDVSTEIRGPEVTAAVSTVAAHQAVRAVLVEQQRRWVAERGGGVVEGRDIGTVVFPNATVKVYLTADEEERARRRHREEKAADRRAAVDEVRAGIERRDKLDSGRAASPLKVADDAEVVDTTGVDVDTVVASIVARARATET
jgi:cytidylate kinase